VPLDLLKAMDFLELDEGVDECEGGEEGVSGEGQAREDGGYLLEGVA
jgi:hypothetical protein